MRQTLLDDARRRARQLVDDAKTKAAHRVDQARSRAHEMIAEAESEGEAVAAAEMARFLAEERRRAREQVLTARREVFESLRGKAASSTQERSARGEMSELWRRLEGFARDQLGADVDIDIQSGGYGFVARADRRQADYTIGSLVDRALETMNSELEGLWQ